VNISEFEGNNKNLRVFPNPAGNSIRILNQELAFEYQIINILGEIDETGTLNPGGSIDVSEFEEGIYFIKLVSLHQSSTLKLIIR
jgi:hypothetical protein